MAEAQVKSGEKNTQEKKGIRLQTLVIVTVAVFFLYTLAVLAVFSHNMNKANGDLADKVFGEQVKVYLAKSAGQLGGWRTASAAQGKVLHDNVLPEDPSSALEHYMASSQAVRAAVLDAEGKGTTTAGTKLDISELPGVEKLHVGECRMFFTEPGMVTAITAIGDETITAYLYLDYSLTLFRERVFHESEREYWCVVLDEHGTILYASNPTKRNYINPGDDFYATMAKASESEAAEIRTNLTNGVAGKSELIFSGDKRILYYDSETVDDQTWTVVMGVVESSYEAVLEPSNGKVRRLAAAMIFGLVFFVGILAYGYVKDSDVGKKKSEGLQHLAETDQLTGLYNKMTTEKKIREYVAQNPNSQGLMFVLDVDNFKKVNDTMGHAFGDQVLKEIGEGLKAQFRSSDIIGRAGGDEFIILLKDIQDPVILVREARKLEHFFQTLQVGGYVKYSATASIGCAIFSQDGQTFEELYKAADQALYQAKRRGKNQLAFFKEPEGFSQNA